MTLDQYQFQRQSSSLAQHQHHAFFYDNDWDLLGVPVRVYDLENSLSGATFFDLSQNKIQSTHSVSHNDWLTQFCDVDRGQSSWYVNPESQDVSRIHRIDNSLLTFSDFGMREHNPENQSIEIKRTLFSSPTEACPLRMSWCQVLN